MSPQKKSQIPLKFILIPIAIIAVLVVLFVARNIFTNNVGPVDNAVVPMSEKFSKVGTFTETVDASLVEAGIDYVKTNYISELKNGFPETDLEKTRENYKCSYVKPAKDDQYLYLNLTCIGDAYNSLGKKTGAPLTGFAGNPTRLKYSLKDGKYIVTEMDQPISPKVYQYSLPSEYINYLNTK